MVDARWISSPGTGIQASKVVFPGWTLPCLNHQGSSQDPVSLMHSTLHQARREEDPGPPVAFLGPEDVNLGKGRVMSHQSPMSQA